MHKSTALTSTEWVKLAVLAPGHSHYWFFDPPWDAYGWVFQATAYPEPLDAGEPTAPTPSRIEVTELFVAQASCRGAERKCASRVNVTVTNCGEDWASYSLWVASIPPGRTAHQARRHDRITPRTATRARS